MSVEQLYVDAMEALARLGDAAMAAKHAPLAFETEMARLGISEAMDDFREGRE